MNGSPGSMLSFGTKKRPRGRSNVGETEKLEGKRAQPLIARGSWRKKREDPEEIKKTDALGGPKDRGKKPKKKKKTQKTTKNKHTKSLSRRRKERRGQKGERPH